MIKIIQDWVNEGLNMGGSAYINGKEYKEFDNFYPSKILFRDTYFPTVEHAFQAMKNDSKEHWDKILQCKHPIDAWNVGRKCELKDDWEETKVNHMTMLVGLKLKQHKDILELLLSTINRDRASPDIIFKGSTLEWNTYNASIWEYWRVNSKLLDWES